MLVFILYCWLVGRYGLVVIILLSVYLVGNMLILGWLGMIEEELVEYIVLEGDCW